MERSLLRLAVTPLKGAGAALLPTPQSGQLARRWGVDVAWWSFLIGLGQAPLAGLLFCRGAVAAISGTAPPLSRLLLENWFEELSEAHFMGTGAIGLLAWYLHPLAWLLAVEGLTGALRVAAFVAGRQPVGEPLAWVALRLAGTVADATRRGSRARDLGPLRPDRLALGSGGELVILSSRDRPEWTPSTTLEVEGRFYRWLGPELQPDGGHRVVAYRWQELDEREVVRRPMPYRPLC